MRLLPVVFLILSLGGVACNRTNDVTIPAGTTLAVVLDTTVGSDTSRVEQAVEAHTTRAIQVNGTIVLPEGTQVRGVVTDATPSGKVKGRASVGVRFNSLVPSGGDRYSIETEGVERVAAATKAKFLPDSDYARAKSVDWAKMETVQKGFTDRYLAEVR